MCRPRGGALAVGVARIAGGRATDSRPYGRCVDAGAAGIAPLAGRCPHRPAPTHRAKASPNARRALGEVAGRRPDGGVTIPQSWLTP